MSSKKGLNAIDVQKEMKSKEELANLSKRLERIEERQKQLLSEISKASKAIEEDRIIHTQTLNVSVEVTKSIGVVSGTELQVGKFDILPGYLSERIAAMEKAYSNA